MIIFVNKNRCFARVSRGASRGFTKGRADRIRRCSCQERRSCATVDSDSIRLFRKRCNGDGSVLCCLKVPLWINRIFSPKPQCL